MKPPRIFLSLLLCTITIFCCVCAPVQAQMDSLSFQRFLQSVLAAHPTMQAAALEQNIARAELQNALGSFDPMIKSNYDIKMVQGIDRVNHFDAEVELPLATLFGPKIMAGFMRGIGSSLNSEERSLGPGGEAQLGISLPLWQGVLTDRRRTNLDKARLRPLLATANQQFEQNGILRLAGVQYWNWAEAFEQLRVNQSVLDISITRANFIAARARRGEVAALDSIEALQEIERRRGDVLRAQRSFEQASIDLAVFLWTQTGEPRPLRELPQVFPPLPRLDSAQVSADRTAALTLRPEMQRIEFNQQSTNLDLQLAYEAQKPFIESKAMLLAPIGVPESQFSLNNYKVGFKLGIPLFFRSAGAQVELFNVSLDRINLQRAQTGRLVQADVDNALNALQRANDRVQAAVREVEFATQMERGERRRFEAGETSLLIVNLRERAAVEARVRLVNARADYLRAYTQYYWATGKIIQLTQ